jgi:hypothetical protein
MTLREYFEQVVLNLTIEYDGEEHHPNLCGIIEGSMMLKRTEACPHSSTNPLKATQPRIITTSVLAPGTHDRGTIAIVMTKGNPTAQLLSCEARARALLMEDCCLDCAVEQAVKIGINRIIVS